MLSIFRKKDKSLLIEKRRNMIISVVVLIIVVSGFIFFNLYSGQNPLSSHKISFNPVSCFSCYGCFCRYTVDEEESYILNESNKRKCLEYTMKDGDIEKREVTVTLSGRKFKDFIECVKKYRDNSSPINN